MNRLQTFWAEIRSSLWFAPTLLTMAAVGLALLTLWLDRTVIQDLEAGDFWWLFGGGAEGARGVLSAIASGIITVTGVLFSITILALQGAATQFSPRILRNFTSDLANQAVLGIFIGTFIYALLIARAVRSGPENGEGFIPALSITIAILLALVSMGFLIYFIHHVARSIQASVVIDQVADDALGQIDGLFPARLGEPVSAEAADGELEEIEAIATVPIRADESGYLQSVDEDKLFDLAERDELVVSMQPWIGDFILPTSVLAFAGPADALTTACCDEIRRTFILGLERTPYQDVEFGIIELMDIAIKALSTSSNDSTTASMCLDRLGEILTRIGQRDEPVRVRTGEAGRLRFIARRTSFDRAVHLALEQIRHYGAGIPAIARRTISMLGEVAELVPDDRREPLLEEVVMVLEAAKGSIPNQADLAMVEREAERVLAWRVGGDG